MKVAASTRRRAQVVAVQTSAIKAGVFVNREDANMLFRKRASRVHWTLAGGVSVELAIPLGGARVYIMGISPVIRLRLRNRSLVSHSPGS